MLDTLESRKHKLEDQTISLFRLVLMSKFPYDLLTVELSPNHMGSGFNPNICSQNYRRPILYDFL